MTPDPNDVARFLEEAVVRGLLTADDAEECRRILAVLAEVSVELGIDEIAIRKGFLKKEDAVDLKRALARRRVGRYEVLERLGSGGTGVVWRARDTRLGRIVALKLLARPRDPADVLSSYAARFEREARTAVTLNHVNIVRGLDFGEADGYVYFAMEFVAGETAAARVRREGRLTEAAAIQIGVQVVDALRHVRRYELVHRDLKPENLLLTPTGEVKVCDLGLAKPTIEESSRLRGSGAIAGTPLYMAPEQIRSPDAIDWRTDVYGLGATLYHLLTGRPPFVPRPGTSVIQRHLTEPVVDPREHVLELSAGASAVVMKMLAKRPDDRYASLDDLAADLSALLDGRPPSYALDLRSTQERVVTSVVAGSQARRRRRPRRRSALIATVSALSAVAVGVGIWPSDGLTPRRPGRRGATHDTVTDGGIGARMDAAGDAEDGAGARRSRTASADHPETRPTAGDRDPLDRARRLEAEGAALEDRIREYRFVAERQADTDDGRYAAERIIDLRAQLETLASAAVDRLLHDAEDAIGSDEYARAAGLLERFPPRFAGTFAYERALAEATRITDEGRGFAQRAYGEASRAAVEWRFDDARTWLARAARTGIRGLGSRARQAQLELELARSAFADERVACASRLQLVAGRALMEALDDPAAAVRSVDEARRDASLRTVHADLDALRPRLELPPQAAAALRLGWARWTEERREVTIRSAGAARRDVTGRAAGADGDTLLVAAAGEAPTPVSARALPADVLVAVIRAGDDPAASAGSSPDVLAAAFLLAVRRPDEAAALGAPPEWVAATRAVAVDEAVARLAEIRAAPVSPVERRRDLDAVIADVAWYGAAYVERGVLLEGLGDIDSALADFATALERDGGRGPARLHLARLLERRAKYAEAEAHLRLFLESPGDASADAVAAAEEAFERVVEARIDVIVRGLWRDARNALRRRDPDAALPIMESILLKRPDDVDALLEVGRLHAQRGAVFAAVRVLRHLVAIDPDGRAGRAGDRELTALRERHSSPPPAAFDALSAGRSALDEGRPGDAVTLFGRVVLLGPFLADGHLALAEAHLALGDARAVRGDFEAALRSAEDTLILVPDHPPALYTRARARLGLGQTEAAVRDAERAAALLPNPASAWLIAGRGSLELGELPDALARFDAAYEARAHGEPLFWQALVLERQGRRQEALARLDHLYSEWTVSAAWREECEALYRRLRD